MIQRLVGRKRTARRGLPPVLGSVMRRDARHVIYRESKRTHATSRLKPNTEESGLAKVTPVPCVPGP